MDFGGKPKAVRFGTWRETCAPFPAYQPEMPRVADGSPTSMQDSPTKNGQSLCLAQLAVLVLTLAVTGLAQADRDKKWRGDLDFMVRQLEVRHALMYEKVSPEQFRRERERIASEIPKLSDNQVIREFARLVAMIGDGHTSIFFWSNRMRGFRRYPIEYWYAKDGLIVLAAAPEYKHLVGMKVRRIGRGTVDEVVAATRPLLGLDNEFGVPKLTSLYIRVPEYLNAIGFAQDMEALELTLEDPDGRERKATIKPVAVDVRPDWQLIKERDALPLWLRRRDEKWWFEYLKDNRLIYLQFNSADVGVGQPEADFIAFCDRLVDTIRREDVDKLIVDLRWNSGGNHHRTRHLLNAIIRSEKINQPGKLFTITSNNTFSAAVMHAARLEQFTNTLFVGEPTSGRPNHSGELRRFYLPNNSGVEVRYSAMYEVQSSPGDLRPAIMPHLKAELTAAEYRAGIDPAMREILAYKPKVSMAPILRETIMTKGVQAGIEQYRKLEADHFNQYIFTESELSGLAYSLYQANRANDAIAVLRLLTTEYPYSASAFNQLATAYMAAGMNTQAIENFRRAFALDKRYTTALENIERLQEMRK